MLKDLRRQAEGATPATVTARFDQVEAAFRALWEQCAETTARAIGRRWEDRLAIAACDLDDALSVLRAHLWVIAPRFDSRQARFTTWWRACAERRVGSALGRPGRRGVPLPGGGLRRPIRRSG